MQPSLVSLLQEVSVVEQAFAKIYVRAARRSLMGELNPTVKVGLHAMRDRVFGLQRACYDAFLGPARTIIPAPVWSQIESRIPAPRPWPDLPTPTQSWSSYPEFFRALEGQGLRGTSLVPLRGGGLRGTGLGFLPALAALPPAVLIAGVILAVALSVVVVWGAIELVRVSGEIFTRAVAERAQTQRYERELEETSRRFDACMSGGGTAEHCHQVVPLPDPPDPITAPEGPAWPIVGLATVGVVAILGVGWAIYSSPSSSRGTIRGALLPGAA